MTIPKFDSEKTKLAMEGTRRADIMPGLYVMVELSEDKRTGRLTGGTVKEVLTSSPTHPHGIKVMLENGQVGPYLITKYTLMSRCFILTGKTNRFIRQFQAEEALC